MSLVALDSSTNYIVKCEALETSDTLEKCGEVFLEREFGNLIYLCTLCDGKFKEVEVFSKHISEVHLTIESFIAYEPDESDGCESFETTPDDGTVKDELEELHQSASESSIMDTEEIFNLIDEAKTTLDIQLMEENELTKTEEVSLSHPTVGSIISVESLSMPVATDSRNLPTTEVTKPENQTTTKSEGAEQSDEEILRTKLKCKFCGDLFDYVKDLRQHDCGLKRHNKLHHCSICGKVFKKKSGLDIHIMTHNGQKPHKCDLCDAAYACKQNLIVHVRRHTGEKPFKCDFCDRSFASSTERISHTRTHTGERPFVCELCGKAHTSSSQLTEHMHRHLDIRNYACEICDKRFRNSYNLRMHRLTHEDGPRKYNCEFCLAAFKTQNNLLQHVKIHQKVKRYVCKICGRAFAQHPGLYSHMKSHAISK